MEELLFTTSQFAKLHEINKRTLHFYDKAGLFSPAVRKANGYRYYAYWQSPALELILTLRELSLPIEQIRRYMGSPSETSCYELLSRQEAEIDRTIERLKTIKALAAEQKERLTICRQAKEGRIELLECGQESLFISEPLNRPSDTEEYAIFMRHIKAHHSYHMFNHTYGSMIRTEKLYSGHYDDYDYFFTMTENTCQKDVFIKPAGRYLRTYCRGDWAKLPAVYEQLISYAGRHGLCLDGYAYERGINEIAITDLSDYMTEITVGVTERKR